MLALSCWYFNQSAGPWSATLLGEQVERVAGLVLALLLSELLLLEPLQPLLLLGLLGLLSRCIGRSARPP